jgi:hypothetical protein
MIRTFLIGNGESRKDFDLNVLKPYGKIYGCNAIYRDHPDLCDALIAVDAGMIHELYHNGMCADVPCYFREWTKVPIHMYDTMLQSMLQTQNKEQADLVVENERGESDHFVMNAHTIKGPVVIRKANDDREKKNIDNAHIYVSWIKEPDKSHNISECCFGAEDLGWCAGTTSGYVASLVEAPDEMYLIGQDLISDTKTVNNLYKSTRYYVSEHFEPNPSGIWETEWLTLMQNNPNVKFYKVNKAFDDKPTNQKVERFAVQEDKNLEYITQAQLLDKMSKW